MIADQRHRLWPGLSVEQFEEFSRRYSSLPQDGAQRASLDGAVLGDDHGPAIRMSVAAWLPFVRT